MDGHVSFRSGSLRPIRIAAVALSLALVVASCGGDDGGGGGSASPMSVSTSSPQDVIDHLLWSLDNEVDGESLAPPDCATAQPGDGRHFLPLWIADGDLSSECTVPSGSTVVLNVGGQFCFDEPDLLETCRAEFNNPEYPVTLGAVSVNGERDDELTVVATPVFRWTPLPVWGLGDDELDAAFHGWYVNVTGLPDGDHVIVTEFEVGGDDPFSTTVTHRLTIG